MQVSLPSLRFAAFVAVAAFATTALLPASAQSIADKIAVKAANSMVSKISGESCSEFAATMAKMKGSGSNASPSPMTAKLKSNPQARAQFVNIVAGPLLNKMIDCNMMPGGM